MYESSILLFMAVKVDHKLDREGRIHQSYCSCSPGNCQRQKSLFLPLSGALYVKYNAPVLNFHSAQRHLVTIVALNHCNNINAIQGNHYLSNFIVKDVDCENQIVITNL